MGMISAPIVIIILRRLSSITNVNQNYNKVLERDWLSPARFEQ